MAREDQSNGRTGVYCTRAIRNTKRAKSAGCMSTCPGEHHGISSNVRPQSLEQRSQHGDSLLQLIRDDKTVAISREPCEIFHLKVILVLNVR